MYLSGKLSNGKLQAIPELDMFFFSDGSGVGAYNSKDSWGCGVFLEGGSMADAGSVCCEGETPNKDSAGIVQVWIVLSSLQKAEDTTVAVLDKQRRERGKSPEQPSSFQPI